MKRRKLWICILKKAEEAKKETNLSQKSMIFSFRGGCYSIRRRIHSPDLAWPVAWWTGANRTRHWTKTIQDDTLLNIVYVSVVIAVVQDYRPSFSSMVFSSLIRIAFSAGRRAGYAPFNFWLLIWIFYFPDISNIAANVAGG